MKNRNKQHTSIHICLHNFIDHNLEKDLKVKASQDGYKLYRLSAPTLIKAKELCELHINLHNCQEARIFLYSGAYLKEMLVLNRKNIWKEYKYD